MLSCAQLLQWKVHFKAEKEEEVEKKAQREIKSQIVIKKIYNGAGKDTCQVSAKDIEFQLTGSSNLLLCFGHQVKTL